jgi:hypothetical protein
MYGDGQLLKCQPILKHQPICACIIETLSINLKQMHSWRIDTINTRMNGQLVKPLKDYMFKLWNTLKKPKHYWNTLHWFMKVMWKLNVELKQWKNPMVNLWNTMQEGHSSLNVLWNNNSSANLWNMHIQVKR